MQFQIPSFISFWKRANRWLLRMFHTNLSHTQFYSHVFLLRIKKNSCCGHFDFTMGIYFEERECQASPFNIQLVEETSCFLRQRKNKLRVHLLSSIMRVSYPMAAREECVRASGNRSTQWALELKAETSGSDKVDGLVVEEREGSERWGHMALSESSWQVGCLWARESAVSKKGRGKRSGGLLSWNAAHFQQVFFYSYSMLLASTS